MSVLLAIDPGKTGGIAHQITGGRPCATPMPETEGDILEYLRAIKTGEDNAAIAYVEEVGGFAGEGMPGSRMFNFGRGFGFLLGCLQALNYRVELVRPQAWQKPLGIGTKASCATPGMKEHQVKAEWKRRLKSKAQQLYPQLEVTLATADAILILDYAKRQNP